MLNGLEGLLCRAEEARRFDFVGSLKLLQLCGAQFVEELQLWYSLAARNNARRRAVEKRDLCGINRSSFVVEQLVTGICGLGNCYNVVLLPGIRSLFVVFLRDHLTIRPPRPRRLFRCSADNQDSRLENQSFQFIVLFRMSTAQMICRIGRTGRTGELD